ncbi:MAG TPA: DinB family protein [Gemmatimonadaceae bacterium]|nr:DinB family protein [Gemmatimonadaceae bacterium]
MPLSTRPTAGEYAPYYDRYISQVPDGGDLVTLLEREGAAMVALVRSLPEEKGAYRYAPGKWSIKEVLGHIIDAERVFTYRALRAARGDRTPMPGFEQDDWVRDSNAASRSLADLATEYAAVRASTVALFRGLDDASAMRRGVANGVEVTPRALAWIVAGHERHHRRILEEQYLHAKGGRPT